MKPFDAELEGLVIDRQRLLAELAQYLHRVGPSQPDRSQRNEVLAVKRKNIRRILKRNADAIAARVMVLYDQQLTLEV